VEQPRGEQPVTVRGESGVGTAGGDLLVSGIAWQEERKLRRAVVNGSLVGEGAEILGARVVEIRENRVRFSRGGKIFEVVYPTP
jgi:general secretion pathway protein B